ncbi:MAG: hypothetical protein Q8L47_01585 [bacterium]|nr:hypothetical protein [bacterium]
MSTNLKILWTLVVVLFAVTIFLAFQFINNSSTSNKNEAYYAVYMDSGEIYFGKLIRNSSLTLNDVYLLVRLQDNAEKPYALKRLKDEQWGPSDSLDLNPSKVVWMTELRSDSEALNAIKSGGNGAAPTNYIPSPSTTAEPSPKL